MSESLTTDVSESSISHQRLALIALVVMGIAITGLLVPIPFHSRVAQAIGNLSHAPLFAGLTLGLLYLLDRIRPVGALDKATAIRLAIVFSGFFLFGIMTETLQSWFGRMPSIRDVMSNGIGILVATLWYGARNLQQYHPDRRLLSRLMLMSAGFALAVSWWSPLQSLRDVATIRWQFPMLATFESEREMKHWEFDRCLAEQSRRDATDGDFSMEVTYQPSSYSTATLVSMHSDWSAMETLELDAVLDDSFSGDSAELLIKIVDWSREDGHSDTFRQQWSLQPGQPQRIRIGRDALIEGPDERELDLSEIRYLHLMLLEPSVPTKVRFDRVRLTLGE